jgi:hypothetical protein
MTTFADLLHKIANNARLTPQELDELKRFGTETQQRNAQVRGIFGSDGNPYFENGITSNGEMYIGGNVVSTSRARVVRNTDQVIGSASLTNIQFESAEYADGVDFSATTDNTKLNIITTGTYRIFFGYFLSGLGSGGGYSYVYKDGVAHYPGVQILIGGILSAYDERYLVAGEYLQLKIFAANGVTVNSCFLAAAKVGL